LSTLQRKTGTQTCVRQRSGGVCGAHAVLRAMSAISPRFLPKIDDPPRAENRKLHLHGETMATFIDALPLTRTGDEWVLSSVLARSRKPMRDSNAGLVKDVGSEGSQASLSRPASHRSTFTQAKAPQQLISPRGLVQEAGNAKANRLGDRAEPNRSRSPGIPETPDMILRLSPHQAKIVVEKRPRHVRADSPNASPQRGPAVSLNSSAQSPSREDLRDSRTNMHPIRRIPSRDDLSIHHSQLVHEGLQVHAEPAPGLIVMKLERAFAEEVSAADLPWAVRASSGDGGSWMHIGAAAHDTAAGRGLMLSSPGTLTGWGPL